MKYIRTKYGIYEVVIEDDEIEVCQVKGHGSIDYKDIVKQADAIEELCDGFVALDMALNGNRYKEYGSLDQAISDRSFLYDRLYGAILTDKGLIYVSKMDEEGNLCLL